jgi:transcriptional regulator with XRE-family HTH domain
MSTTGNFMKSTRARLGLTTSEVAAKMGFSRSALTKWEIGTSLPPVDAVQRWATALNLGRETRSAVLTLRKWEKLGGK